VAVQSYLSDVAGGMVVGGAFEDDAAAAAAIDLLGSSGVRPQDISVLAANAPRADRLAGDRAWTPSRNASGPAVLRRLLRGGRLPSEIRRRYGDDLRHGRVVIVIAADGQPPDTIAALLGQARAARIEQWWQPPASLFAPPELAGPF
jgi:hypothetical protein